LGIAIRRAMAGVWTKLMSALPGVHAPRRVLPCFSVDRWREAPVGR
jgi:hypothetical protein